MIAVQRLSLGVSRYGSKVPGLVVTVPPTAKLPCSWITKGRGLAVSSAMALPAAMMPVEMSRSATVRVRRFGLMKFSRSHVRCPTLAGGENGRPIG
jgi:hypothetical protein